VSVRLKKRIHATGPKIISRAGCVDQNYIHGTDESVTCVRTLWITSVQTQPAGNDSFQAIANLLRYGIV